MGRGRTTTGMVIASLAYLKRIGATDAAGSHDLGDTPAGAVPEWLEDGIQQSLNNQVRACGRLASRTFDRSRLLWVALLP